MSSDSSSRFSSTAVAATVLRAAGIMMKSVAQSTMAGSAKAAGSTARRPESAAAAGSTTTRPESADVRAVAPTVTAMGSSAAPMVELSAAVVVRAASGSSTAPMVVVAERKGGAGAGVGVLVGGEERECVARRCCGLVVSAMLSSSCAVCIQGVLASLSPS